MVWHSCVNLVALSNEPWKPKLLAMKSMLCYVFRHWDIPRSIPSFLRPTKVLLFNVLRCLHFTTLLSRCKPHLDTIVTSQRQRQLLNPRLRISAFKFAKLLNDTDSDIARLGKSVLLTQADPWTTVERQVLPTWTQICPSLWLVLVGIFAVEIFSSMHDKRRVTDHCAFRDEEWVLAVRAAAKREESVANGEARV